MLQFEITISETDHAYIMGGDPTDTHDCHGARLLKLLKQPEWLPLAFCDSLDEGKRAYLGNTTVDFGVSGGCIRIESDCIELTVFDTDGELYDMMCDELKVGQKLIVKETNRAKNVKDLLF